MLTHAAGPHHRHQSLRLTPFHPAVTPFTAASTRLPPSHNSIDEALPGVEVLELVSLGAAPQMRAVQPSSSIILTAPACPPARSMHPPAHTKDQIPDNADTHGQVTQSCPC